MTDAGLTLGELLPIDRDALGRAIKDHLDGTPGARAAALKPVLDLLTARAADCLKGALDADLFEVAAGSIAALRELHQYSGPDQPPGGAEATLTYGENALKAPLVLRLHIEVDGFESPALELTLDFRLVFDALAVTVKAGRIRAIGVGPGRAQASMRYKDTVLAGPFEQPFLKLPPKPLDPGFAIP